MPSLSKILCLSSDYEVKSTLESVVRTAYDFEFREVDDSPFVLDDFLPEVVLLDASVSFEAITQWVPESILALPTLVLVRDANSSIDTLLKAHKFGGFDVLAFPFDKYALSNKLKVIESCKKALNTSGSVRFEPFGWEQCHGLPAVPSDALLAFIEYTYEIGEFSGLAKALLKAALSCNLEAQVMFSTAEGESFFSSDGRSLTPIERQILLENRAEDYCEFQGCLQLNSPHISLLLGFPQSIADGGRIGDYGPLFRQILKAASAKFKSLNTEQALIRQTTNLIGSFEIVQSTIGNIRSTLDNNRREMSELLDGMVFEATRKISQVGLSSDQQRSLLSQMDETLRSAKLIIDKSYSSNLVFDSVVRLLRHLIDKQNELLEENKSEK